MGEPARSGQGKHVSQARCFIQLGEDHSRRSYRGETFGRVRQGSFAGNAGEDEQDLVRFRLAEEGAEFLDFDFVTRAAAGRVHEDQVKAFHSPDRFAHFSRRRNDLHGKIDDVGIGSQLFDGGDTVGVDGDEAHVAFFTKAEIGCQFCDGCCLAHAGGAYQGDETARAGSDFDGAGGGDLGFQHGRNACFCQDGVIEFGIRGFPSHTVNEFPCNLFAEIDFDQIGEEAEETVGQIVRPGHVAVLSAEFLQHGSEVRKLVLDCQCGTFRWNGWARRWRGRRTGRRLGVGVRRGCWGRRLRFDLR